MLADRFAERLADLAEGDGFVERCLGDANAARRDIDASQFEAGERVLQAPALLPANQPVGRDFVIRKDQLGRVEPLIAELFELFADREPRPLLGQEEAHAAVARLGGEVRFDQEREDLAVDTVRDPSLGAVDDVTLISLRSEERRVGKEYMLVWS